MSNRLNLWLCLLLVLCAVPAGVLLLSYGAISIHMRNPWPWLELVHESGDRTLVGTILYFDHAARELPLDLILGLGVGGSAAFALGAHGPNPGGRRHLRWEPPYFWFVR